MPTGTNAEKERKRAAVARGVIKGKRPAQIAKEIGCNQRHVERLAEDPATQVLITDLMRPYRVRLRQLVPKAIRAVERGLVAQKTTRSDMPVQLHAVRRMKDLLVLAQGDVGPPPETQEGFGQVTWEEFQVMYKRRTESGNVG